MPYLAFVMMRMTSNCKLRKYCGNIKSVAASVIIFWRKTTQTYCCSWFNIKWSRCAKVLRSGPGIKQYISGLRPAYSNVKCTPSVGGELTCILSPVSARYATKYSKEKA